MQVVADPQLTPAERKPSLSWKAMTGYYSYWGAIAGEIFGAIGRLNGNWSTLFNLMISSAIVLSVSGALLGGICGTISGIHTGAKNGLKAALFQGAVTALVSAVYLAMVVTLTGMLFVAVLGKSFQVLMKMGDAWMLATMLCIAGVVSGAGGFAVRGLNLGLKRKWMRFPLDAFAACLFGASVGALILGMFNLFFGGMLYTTGWRISGLGGLSGALVWSLAGALAGAYIGFIFVCWRRFSPMNAAPQMSVATLSLALAFPGVVGAVIWFAFPTTMAYETLLREWESGRDALFDHLSAGQEEADQARIWSAFERHQEEYTRRFLELAERMPRASESAEAALWLLQYAPASPEAEAAVDILIHYHLSSKSLERNYQHVALAGRSRAAETLLRALAEQHPQRAVQGQACYSLARYYQNQADLIKNHSEAEDLVLQAEQLFTRVVEDYADVPSKNGTLGERATLALDGLHNLAIGKPALEIEGTDIDGNYFKLSDYRGKVVVLDFWGNW